MKKVWTIFMIVLMFSIAGAAALSYVAKNQANELESQLNEMNAIVKAMETLVQDIKYKPAQRILGPQLITPEEATRARLIGYTDEQLRHLADTLPSEETLRWLKANDYALVPGPPTPLTLSEIAALTPELIGWKDWYYDQESLKSEKVSAEWLAVRMAPVKGSIEQNFETQRALLSKKERIPNATETAWFITTYYLARKVKLFENEIVRTASPAGSGKAEHIGIGNFDDKLVVSGWFDHYQLSHLGLASALK